MEVASHVVNSPAPPPSFTGPGVSDSSSTGTGSTPASELALGSTTASTMTTATTTSASPTLNMGMPPNNSAVMMHQQYHGMKADDPSMTVSVGAPTSINTSLASASSAMTPTTVNFAMNAQLAKSTGTLTPMGEDKVSTAGPVAVQKAKQSKKKANADGEAPKKPSPRVRTPATKSEKAEKRKASPSRGSGVDTPTGNGMASVPASNGQSMGQPPAQPASQPAGPLASNPTYASMSDNSTNSYDTPPAQDIELRKLFLQKIYRQLQMTHRNQDDLTVRRIATNIEMEICRRASDRNEYVMLVQQQVNSLMQAELTNGNVGNQASVYAPGQNPSAPGVTAAMSHPSQTNGAMPTRPGGQHGQGNSYGQSAPSVPSAPEMNQRGSSGGQGSFMSLLSSQAPVQSQDSMRPQTQFMAQPRPPQYANIPPNYAPPSDTMAGQTGPMESQSGLTNQNIPGSFPPQRAQVSSSSTSAPPEFAAQFQRLDRTGLVDLLWTQHRTLLQYQRRMAQIEVQLNGRQQSPGVGVPANAMPPSAPANPNGYYNHVPPHQPPTTAGVPSTLSAEAEAQRTLDRRNSRAGQQQSQYPSGQVQTPYTANPVVVPPPSNVNPAVYWEKVRVLKDAFLRPLYIAHQALAQHNAPANSAQGVKAENVRHNIGLACSILSEPPKAHQPRPLEVLESIERFILSTVVPIVKKVYPQGDTASPPATTEATTPHQLRPPQHQSTDYAYPSRNSLGSSQSTGHSTPHMAIPQNGESTPSNSVAPLAPSSAPPKSGAKAAVPKTKSTARKSPTNGQKKATAPKSSTPKTGAKSGGKKNNAKSSGKQPPNGTVPQNPEGMVEQQSQGPSSVEEAQPTNEGVDPPKSGAIADDDSLNDFSDFADLDFGDDLQDPLSKVQNKENSTEPNARKRSFEDV